MPWAEKGRVRIGALALLKASAAAYRNVRLRECKNAEFVRGLNKAAVSRAVYLRECPLRELRL